MESEKEIYFVRRIADEPKLCYKEEKDVVAKALRKYISNLESAAYDIRRR